MILSDLRRYFLERHKGIKKNNFGIRNIGFLLISINYINPCLNAKSPVSGEVLPVCI